MPLRVQKVTAAVDLVLLSLANGATMERIQSVDVGLTPIVSEINQLGDRLLLLHRSLSSVPAELKEAVLLEIEQLALKQQALMQQIMEARKNAKNSFISY